MVNCLTTIIDVSVDNEELRKESELFIPIDAEKGSNTDKRTVRFFTDSKSNEFISVRIIGDGYIMVEGDGLEFSVGKSYKTTSYNQVLYLSEGKYTLVVSDKELIKNINIHVGGIAPFKYLEKLSGEPNLQYLDNANINDLLYWINVSTIYLNYAKAYGNINLLAQDQIKNGRAIGSYLKISLSGQNNNVQYNDGNGLIVCTRSPYVIFKENAYEVREVSETGALYTKWILNEEGEWVVEN